jgi:hypothetical protein
MPKAPDWRDDARCATYPEPHIWDYSPAHYSGPPDQGEVALAVALCRRCPVAAQCLADAVRTEDVWTIRGGMIPAERYRAGLHPDWTSLRHYGRPVVRRRLNQ